MCKYRWFKASADPARRKSGGLSEQVSEPHAFESKDAAVEAPRGCGFDPLTNPGRCVRGIIAADSGLSSGRGVSAAARGRSAQVVADRWRGSGAALLQGRGLNAVNKKNKNAA